MGVLRFLEAIRSSDCAIKFFQASTSELFGCAPQLECDEYSPVCPISPYGCSKAFAHFLVQTYRRAYGVFACNGILFNHESPRRGESFVTRKITMGLARISMGLEDRLLLGSLDARRDWGYAGDYVDCMWRMLQQNSADDYVIATGKTHSVREFVEEAARYFNLSIHWEGTGVDEVGVDGASGRKIIQIDGSKYRVVDTKYIFGNASKAEINLGWRPGTNFSELVKLMANSEAGCIAKMNEAHVDDN
jgi:GDPmannose 4,6-dehydratase